MQMFWQTFLKSLHQEEVKIDWFSNKLVETNLVYFYCSVEIILRAEAVEQAQAGDKCDFTGTLIVVPDVGQLTTPGKRPFL